MSRIIRICLALVAGVMLATVIWAPASGVAQDGTTTATAEEKISASKTTTIVVNGEEGAENAPTDTTTPSRQPGGNRPGGSRPYKAGFGYTIRGEYSLVNLNQNSPAWAGNPFCHLGGGRTMAGSACGVTSLAMVGQTLTGRRSLSPPRLARKYCSRIIQGGTLSYFHSGDLVLRILKDMGLKARRSGGDLNLVRRTVQRGGLAIVLFGPGRFTGGGHFLVIRAARDGKLYFADPYGTGQFGYNNEAEGIPEGVVRANGMITTWTAER